MDQTTQASATRKSPEIIEGDATHAPLEPLYRFSVAVEMIPMPSANALRQFLFKHKEIKPVYRRTRWYEVGFLSLTQIKQIRAMTFHGFEESRYTAPGHGGRGQGARQQSAIASIMQRAMVR